MDRESELELVERLRAGDATAFDVVYHEFNARLFSFLARLTRNRERAGYTFIARRICSKKHGCGS